MEEKKCIVQVQNVWKSFEKGRIDVLRGVSLSVAAGELVALCGPSGGGKSTLLHLIAGLDTPDQGAILLAGKAVRSERSLVHSLRWSIGFVFQLHNLIPDLTVEENCLIPAIAAGQKRVSARERFNYLSAETGLSHRQNHLIQELSGGERQRTAICRALMNGPALILADEPTGALDEKSRDQVFSLLLRLVREEGSTLIMATHERTLAEACERLLVVKDGRVFESSAAMR